MCVLAVSGMQQQGARSRHQQSNNWMSWTVADVQIEYFCDRTFWTGTDALQGAQVVLELCKEYTSKYRKLATESVYLQPEQRHEH